VLPGHLPVSLPVRFLVVYLVTFIFQRLLSVYVVVYRFIIHIVQIAFRYLSRPTQPGHPYVVCAMTIGCGFGHHWGRNAESCLAVDPVTRTAGILAEVG